MELSELLPLAIGATYKMLLASAALVCVWLWLRLLDAAAGMPFKEWVKNASKADLGEYYGYRFIGACVLFGFIFS